MSKKLMRKKLALMLSNLKEKRPFYTEVEYLESSGTQYIDTGISAPSGYRGVVTLAPLAKETATLVGTQLGGKNNRLLTNSGRIKVACAETQYLGAPFTVGTKYDIDFCTEEDYYLIVDGVQANAGNNPNGRSAGNLYVFAGTRQSAVGYFSKMKLYCLKLYVGNVLVRDYIPVLDWNMTPCLYDKVSGLLFYNAGTGDFVYGQ